MATSILDKPDEWLKPLRKRHPIAGWTITIALLPIALVFGIVGLLLILLIAPFIGLGGLVLAALAFAKLLFKEQFRTSKPLAGAITIIVLSITSSILYWLLGPVVTIVALAFTITGLMLGFLDNLGDQ